MLEALAVVHNFTSSVDTSVLEFGEFTLRRIDANNHDAYRNVFTSGDVFQNDWVYKREYPDLVFSTPLMSGPIKRIPQDTEDVLFLLRLYKVGDIGFHNQIIRSPGGTRLEQAAYSNMNTLNRDSAFTTELEPEECPKFMEFANGIRGSQSWGASWFSIARRYFIYGSGKQYTPQWDEVDRIVNYGTALEATLTPEQDFTKNRFMNRAARLIAAENDGDPQKTLLRMKELYNLRSTIVHGRALSEEQVGWLTDNAFEIELVVRKVLAHGVQKIPADDQGRQEYLSQLYDVEDSKRGEATLSAFYLIETPEVRENTIKTMGKKMKWECTPKL